MGRLAKHQKALLLKPEAHARKCRKLLKAFSAGKAKISEQRRGPAHMGSGGRFPEIKAPADEFEIEAGLDVERRRRIPHPFQPHRDHARRGQRYEVAGNDHPGISKRCAFVLGHTPIDNSDLHALQRTIIRGAQADDPSPYDGYVLAHRIPQQNGSFSLRHKVASELIWAMPVTTGTICPEAWSTQR